MIFEPEKRHPTINEFLMSRGLRKGMPVMKDPVMELVREQQQAIKEEQRPKKLRKRDRLANFLKDWAKSRFLIDFPDADFR